MSAPQDGARNAATDVPAAGVPGRRGRRRLLAGLLVGLVLLAATAAWILQRGDSSPAGEEPRASAPAATTPAERPAEDAESTAPSPGSEPAGAPTGVPPAVLAGGEGRPAALPPVGLDQVADYGDGVTAALVDIEALEAEAGGVGETSGPAVAATIELTNRTAAPVSLATVAVNLYRGADGAPASPVRQASSDPFAGSLEPGASARATYVFRVPEDQRGVVTVTVLHAVTSGFAVFSGAVA